MGAQGVCAPFLSGDELALGTLMRRRRLRTGPEDPHSLVCDTVERSWSLVRKQVVNPCSATYWSWAGRLSPRRLSFRICKTESDLVCLPSHWQSLGGPDGVALFRGSPLCLTRQAPTHSACAWERGLWASLGSWAAAQ